MKVAIIGAGMAGIGTMRYYIDHVEVPFELYIYDTKRDAGVGYPFGPDDKALLLNQRLRKMTLAPWDDKEEYIKYLERKRPESLEKEFISRAEFGEYTNDVFNQYIEDPRVTFIPEIVSDITVDGDSFTLHIEDRQEVFDVVHLCIGQLPQTDFYDLKGTDAFISTPFPINAYKDQLLRSDSVGIIGSSLTAIDIMMFLYTNQYNGKILAASRSGVLPFIRGSEADITITKDSWMQEQETPSISHFMEAIEDELNALGIDFNLVYELNDMSVEESLKWQLQNIETMGKIETVVTTLTVTLRKLWNQYPQHDREYFMKELKSLIMQLEGPFPMETAEKLVEMIEKNQLLFVSHLSDIEYRDTFILRDDKSTYNTELLVNATGPNMNGEHLADTNNASGLVKQLIDRRIFTRDELGGILVTYPEFSVISQAHGVLSRMKLYGNLISSTHVINSGVNLILSQIPQTIDTMLESIKNKK
ncbi:FAD/NAD(P)-binding protein [Phocicoccus pinnipedialis]|uniref:FAD-dependent urate hydroxylase HpyO/Asp monooxygenase CreE-like FAD/NAD(P)-binding domain-containing protein n=1 Tax=Phocicoccus pinnipedialis TaxID=110845 RepID=A0A6V7R4I2_9BACL|nr:FAD/NAD(P)-binding protein [Jeotgalicoccus pinnipedialis]MBP1939668.1 putative NAD(P)/FAD-binding protein YdhS [Jeotgalicoccus pinnipedialis]CAD2072290.1 hypothetical protein JEOPIN946_00388 [Jeotgalicoccus pinnipedialis]